MDVDDGLWVCGVRADSLTADVDSHSRQKVISAVIRRFGSGSVVSVGLWVISEFSIGGFSGLRRPGLQSEAGGWMNGMI